MSKNTHHKTDEELECGRFKPRDKSSTVPEDERDDKEDEGLRERVEEITPDSRLVRLAQGSLQRFRVEPEAVFLTSESSDSANGSGGLARQLRGVFVRLLVGLVLENDNALQYNHKHLHIQLQIICTYKANVTSRHEKRRAS